MEQFGEVEEEWLVTPPKAEHQKPVSSGSVRNEKGCLLLSSPSDCEQDNTPGTLSASHFRHSVTSNGATARRGRPMDHRAGSTDRSYWLPAVRIGCGVWL